MEKNGNKNSSLEIPSFDGKMPFIEKDIKFVFASFRS